MAVYNTYTAEQERFLKENAPKMSRKELTALFNAEFGTNRSMSAVKAYCNKRGYHSSNDGRFKPGNISWQKGLRGEEFKSHFTEESFKRSIECMLRGKRTRKIGDEIIKNGEPFIVTSLEYGVPFHDRRKPKRRVVWEQLHGEIPKGHCIICLDGNPMNCEPDNLYCLPIKYRTLLSRNKWWSSDRELTLAAIKWCELHYAIKECK